MPFSNEIRAGASGAQSTALFNDVTSRSLRLEKDDSSYLNFTNGTATDISKWTVNFWWKQGAHTLSYSSDYVTLWGVEGPGTTSFSFIEGDLHFYLNYNSGGSQIVLRSNRKFRDPSAWYNFHVKFDRAQGTAANRLKIFVNGVDLDDEGGYSTDQRSTIASDSSSGWNVSGTSAAIGRRSGDTASRYSQGYMAYFHNIDGQYLDATDFIQIKDGVCVPKLYSGSYGNNGWKLEFLQTGTGTASSSTIGADTSGNDNHWTSNNLASTDIMLDHPENNFCTLNPVAYTTIGTLTQGNLTLATSTNNRAVHGTFSLPPSGKWYYEVHIDSVQSGGAIYYGWSTDTSLGVDEYAPSKGIFFSSYNEQVLLDGSGQSGGYGSTGTDRGSNGDIYSILLDVDNGRFYYAKNGTYFNSADPAAGTGGLDVSATLTAADTRVTPCLSRGGSYNETYSVNFGQDSKDVSSANSDENGFGTFEHSVPAGFLALCSANLPDPTIGPNLSDLADENFNTVLYTGNGSTQSITGVGFQPNWTWIKNRDQNDSNVLTDSVRGVTKELQSDTATDEITNADGLTSFDSDGFSLGADVAYNTSTESYVSWNWKMGTAFSNDASATGVGTIDSTGSVNTTNGQAIISYTGTGSAGTIAHGLNSAPDWIMVKNRDDNSKNWNVYVPDLGNTYLELNNGTAGFTGSSYFNNTAPTDSVFSVGTAGSTNASTDAFIAYVFHSVEGYSRYGVYEGNANADGSYVYLGFRPRWFMFKDAANTNIEWNIFYDEASPFNEMDDYIAAGGNAAAESTNVSTRKLDFVSNGVKFRDANAQNYNAKYVYMAFAKTPFKFANAR